MSTAIVTHKDCILHETGINHPESKERLIAVNKSLKAFKSSKIKWFEGQEIESKYFYEVHTKSYFQDIKKKSPTDEPYRIDADTILSKDSLRAALVATGSVCKAVDLVLKGNFRNAFCPIRPPGHHAEPERAMGFCFFNNVAIAANYAKIKYGINKCAVIDFDVHHGNGTQKMFWDKPNMFYASTHQEGIFPGTGFKDETGIKNNIINVPLPAGTDSELFKKSYDDLIIPALNKFAPDIIFVSAGFDAHIDDPLADFRLTNKDFYWITKRLNDFAIKNCKGKLISCLEGGYNIKALSESSLEHVKGLIL